MQALGSLRVGTGKEGMGWCPVQEGLRKDQMRAAEGAACFPEEGTVCSKTPGERTQPGRQVFHGECEEPVLGSALPGIRGRKRGIAFLLKVRRGAR